jgi:hypothetical protein
MLCGTFRLCMLLRESTLRHCKNVIWARHRAVKLRYTVYAATWCVFQAVMVTSVTYYKTSSPPSKTKRVTPVTATVNNTRPLDQGSHTKFWSENLTERDHWKTRHTTHFLICVLMSEGKCRFDSSHSGRHVNMVLYRNSQFPKRH